MKEEKILTKDEINDTGYILIEFDKYVRQLLIDHNKIEIDLSGYNGEWGWDKKEVVKRAIKELKEKRPIDWDAFYKRFYNKYLNEEK